SLPPPGPPLFPYTTLFRSHLAVALVGGRLAIRRRRRSLSVALPVALAVVLAGWLLTVALRGGLVRGLLGEARRVVRTLVLGGLRSEEHTSELQSRFDLVCR